MSKSPPDGYSSQATDPLPSVKAGDESSRQWWLKWVYPEPLVTLIDRTELSLGRDPSCDVVLSDAKVSRRHATIQLGPQSAPLLRDLGSSNGTAVDGERCETAWLSEGCVLRLGQSLAVVVHAEEQPETTRDLSTDSRWPYIGSEKLQATLDRADRIAQSPGALFIHAETGTGKEYLARRVHAASGRSGDFVPVNCAGVRGELAVSQLFGHVKGAFTGATHTALGALRQADKGTVFLDEIAELPLDSQALLLRATQAQELTPLGSSVSVPVNFRVICASHANLLELVAKQAFRADLYYRLSTHQLSLPALKQRKEDILGLFECMSGIAARRLQSRFAEQLLTHDWPGNIRELANAVMALRAQAEEPERWKELPFLPKATQRTDPPANKHSFAAEAPVAPGPLSPARLMTAEEWQGLYAKYSGNAAEVARVTGLKASTVKRYFATLRQRET